MISQQLALLETLSTGDELPLTSGEIWSCTLEYNGSRPLAVALVKGSFAEARERGEFAPTYSEVIFPHEVKAILVDAVKGGATIYKGVGLVLK